MRFIEVSKTVAKLGKLVVINNRGGSAVQLVKLSWNTTYQSYPSFAFDSNGSDTKESNFLVEFIEYCGSVTNYTICLCGENQHQF